MSQLRTILTMVHVQLPIASASALTRSSTSRVEVRRSQFPAGPFEGDLASTARSSLYNEINQKLNQLAADKDATIVLYCRSGRMSDSVAHVLAQYGYTNVRNCDGSVFAWEQASLELARQS